MQEIYKVKYSKQSTDNALALSFSARYIECTARQYHLVTDSRKICAIFNELQGSHLTDDLMQAKRKLTGLGLSNKCFIC